MSILKRTFKLSKFIIKLAFATLILAVNIFLLWRVFSSSDPRSLTSLTPNEALYEAYLADNSLSDMFTQKQRTLTSAEKNAGYFSVSDTVVIPSANQLQLIFRYNNSTIRALAEDYSLSEVPSRDTELYEVSLLVATDLTPENTEDNLSNAPESVKFTRIYGRLVATEQKNLYNYRKFVFDFGELDISSLLENKTLLAIYTDVYYNGDINYENEPYGTLCLYDYLSEDLPIKPSSADIRALDDWGKKNG